ncbi:hypothetical protein X975_15776, partial [Stegodyphus mimosarum]
MQQNMDLNSGQFNEREKLNFQQQEQNFHQRPLYPPQSYPRAHRLQTNNANNGITKSQTYSNNHNSNINKHPAGVHGTSYELDVDVSPRGVKINDSPYSSEIAPTNYNQNGQDNAPNGLYYNNGQAINDGRENLGSNNYASNTYGSQQLSSNPQYTQSSTQYSQPVYNPAGYAEYLMSQQQSNQQPEYSQSNISQQYSQPYEASKTAQENLQNVMAQASNQGIASQISNQGAMSLPSQGVMSHISNQGATTQADAQSMMSQSLMSSSQGLMAQQPSHSTMSQIPNQGMVSQASNQGINNQESNQSIKQDVSNQGMIAQTSDQGMLTQASKLQNYYQQYPSNTFNNGFRSVQQMNGFSNVPQLEQYSNYNAPKPKYPEKPNYDFDNMYKQVNKYQMGRGNSLPWQTNNYQNQNTNDNNFQQFQQYNQQLFGQIPTQNNEGLKNGFFNNPGNLKPGSQAISSINTEPKNNLHNFNDFLPSGSSASSSSYSNSYSPPHAGFHATSSENTMFRQNEKFDQSSSQNSYASSSNIAVPGPFTPSGSSVSYSSNAYGSNYGDARSYSPQATNQVYSHSHGSQMTNSVSKDHPTSASTSHSTHIGSGTYSQPSSSLSKSYSSSNSYDVSSQGSYQTPSFEFSPPKPSFEFSPQATYQMPVQSKPEMPLFSQNESQTLTSFSNAKSLLTNPGISTSYSYSYSQQVSDEIPDSSSSAITNPMLNIGLPKTFAQLQSSQQSQNREQNDPFALHANSVTKAQSSNALQNSKLDEMEEHVQSSASSIIKFYTNSPDSEEGKRGQSFTFMDSSALESSPSATFYHPDDPTSNSKIGYSSEDLKIIQGPSYSQDPAEPLQTSLDAYVPAQPIYQASSSDQNTVYKEAASENDGVYKEAVSIASESNANKSR